MAAMAWVFLGVFLAFWWWLWWTNEKRETADRLDEVRREWIEETRRRVWSELDEALARFQSHVGAEHPRDYALELLAGMPGWPEAESQKWISRFKWDWFAANRDRLRTAYDAHLKRQTEKPTGL